ncbi:uncharacterized protein [Periplaneta americana]|uniref:uncharacterized protein n=1 Tax=Periplaneta americana TaxID=6978 RepID=UPI0037E7D379
MSGEISTWSRPSSVPFPTVWRKYEGTSQMADGKKPKFVIQDLTEDLLEDVIELMCFTFCKEESIFGSVRITEDPVSLNELGEFFRRMWRDKVAVVALLDDGSSNPRIAGFNMLCICRKQDKFCIDDYKGPALRTVLRDLLGYAANYVNIFEHYDVKEYLGAFGLFVHPDFRRQGLAAELLRARENLCKSVGLQATMTFFTSLGGHNSGHKAGLDLLAEIPYNVFKTEDGQEVYPGIQPKSIKVMGTSYR